MTSETKERLLLAALKVFAQKGYRGATVREIAQEAGAANLNTVSYYFGGKEGLYRAALEHCFLDSDVKWTYQPQAGRAPEEELAAFVLATCQAMYGEESELDSWRGALFIHEMAQPSPFLDELASLHLEPLNQELRAILIRLLGPRAPRELVLDCALSIMGQILYYYFCWPLLSRLEPGRPPMHQHLEHVASHVTHFSLAGLAAARRALEEQES